MVNHLLIRLQAFHIGTDAGCWGTLDAAFMDGVLAHCNNEETSKLKMIRSVR